MIKDALKSLQKFATASVAAKLPLAEMDRRGKNRRASRKLARKQLARRANLTHRAVGRLVFHDSPDKPLTHFRVELWDRDVNADDYLGEGITDATGRFCIEYDPADAGPLDTPDLALHLVDDVRGVEVLVFEIRGANNVTEVEYDFGTHPVPYYAYHPDIPLPHVLTFDYGQGRLNLMPQSYPVGRKLALAQVAKEVLDIRLRHYMGGADQTVQQIQDAYRGRTTYTPPGPGPGASDDEILVERLLNGAAPAVFTTTSDGRVHLIYRWDDAQMDGVHWLPNVHGVFEAQDGTLVPRSITVQERKDNGTEPGSELAAPVTSKPGEPGWPSARHTLLFVNYLDSQLSNHLARGHFNAEQWAMGAFRNLHANPLRELLLPHLQEVMVINVEGEAAIFGPDGLITKNSALTSTSVVQRIRRAAQTLDWYGWSPRAPIGPGHRYARVANRYWELLGAYIDQWFDDNLVDVIRYWSEVQGFSSDVVGHSVPHAPATLPEGHAWADANEVARADAPRVEVDGHVRTITPFAPAGECTEEHVAHLMAACRYAIFHATFWHAWVNDTTDALEPSYAQYSALDRATPKEITDHISINLALSQTRYGLIVANEDEDVPELFVDMVKAAASDFEALGYDVRNLRSRINI